VREHLGCASESLLADVTRDVQELVDRVRVFSLPPDLDLVRHWIIEVHVLGITGAMTAAPTWIKLGRSRVTGWCELMVVVAW